MNISYIILGLVFFIAGVLKLMDPVGAGLVVTEYFNFFGMDFMAPVSKFIATVMALLESVIGVGLMAGVYKKVMTAAAQIFLAFFTVLTLIFVIFNPQMDCGCFGEAIHLTHLQTFLKNLALCVLAFIGFRFSKKSESDKKPKRWAFYIVSASTVAFMFYSWMSLPMVDFTAFKPGAELISEANTGDIADQTLYVYEKNGNLGTFPLTRLPDSTWTFVEVQTVKSNRPLLDSQEAVLSIRDDNGNYRDELAVSGNVYIVSVYDTKKLKLKEWAEISESLMSAYAVGMRPLLLVTDTSQLPMDFSEYAYSSDYKTIISLNRSNGGASWVADGTIIKKWTDSGRPIEMEMQELMQKSTYDYMLNESTEGRLWFQAFFIYTLALLLIL